jgi:hypothetical protein
MPGLSSTGSAGPKSAPRRRIAVAAALAAALALGVAAAPSANAGSPRESHHSAAAPHTVVLNGKDLQQIKRQLPHSKSLEAELAKLTTAANAELTTGPWSVMDKAQTPTSGDKHDYLSQAPYLWPTEAKTAANPYGCPYITKDGDRNPDADAISDHAERLSSWTAIADLALAWYYTGKKSYATRAELDIRTWFTNPATAMNPNLLYAQIIPCSTDIRGSGIIDSSEQITGVIDAFALLDSGAPGWKKKDHTAVTKWLTTYLGWMNTSPQGQVEQAATNNHGSFIDSQDAAIALYIGDTAQAKAIVTTAETKRIAAQIQPDGSQPRELARTLPWQYSTFNLTALCRLASTARNTGVNLWAYTAPNGASLAKAVSFLLPAAEHGNSAWPYPDLANPIDQSLILHTLHAAADQGNDAQARAAIPLVPAPSTGDQWALRPTC